MGKWNWGSPHLIQYKQARVQRAELGAAEEGEKPSSEDYQQHPYSHGEDRKKTGQFSCFHQNKLGENKFLNSVLELIKVSGFLQSLYLTSVVIFSFQLHSLLWRKVSHQEGDIGTPSPASYSPNFFMKIITQKT